jgi:hypothetical protein
MFTARRSGGLRWLGARCGGRSVGAESTSHIEESREIVNMNNKYMERHMILI